MRSARSATSSWLRLRWPRYHFLRLTRTMLRPHERRGLAGATYMAVAYAAAVLFFPKPIAVMAMLFNGFGAAGVYAALANGDGLVGEVEGGGDVALAAQVGAGRTRAYLLVIIAGCTKAYSLFLLKEG